jgi:potassium-dependent mechanosensitive channel
MAYISSSLRWFGARCLLAHAKALPAALVAALCIGCALSVSAPAQAQNAQPAAPTQSESTGSPNGAPPTPNGLPANDTATPAAPATPAPEIKTEAPAPPLETDPLYPGTLVSRSRALSAEILRLQKAVERVSENDTELAKQREAIERLEAEARGVEQRLAEPMAAVSTQISRLGERPKDGEPAEPQGVVQERERLDRIRTEIDGAIRTANLTQLRARQLTGQIQNLQLTNFARNLFERRTSPVESQLWNAIMDQGARMGRQLGTIWSNWWGIASDRLHWLALALLIGLGLYGGLRLLRGYMLRRTLVEPQAVRASFFRRAATALWLAPVVALPAIAGISAAYAAFEAFLLMNSQVRPLFQSAWIAFVVYQGVKALAEVILLPRYPSWRLVSIQDGAAHRILSLSKALAVVYVIDMFLGDTIRMFFFPVELGIAVTSFANIIFAALLARFAMVPMPMSSERSSERIVATAMYWLKLPIFAVGLVIVVSTLLGYIAFARFVAGQVLLVACVFVAALLAHLAIRALTSPPVGTEGPSAKLFGRDLPIGPERARQIAGVLSFFLNTVLLLGSIGVLLLSWGFSDALLLGWLRALIFGFEIGQFRISLFKILIAVGLFLFVIFITRLLQRWLATRVLTENRVDAGIANSVQQGLGYAGLALAALVGVSYVGLDITNLAIVAGALSVGIGFGLQSIVNNFVSGLILLAERPVKVGDWIVVGAHQGYVRRISVRATEIETFDRASLIIPNSELITGTVQNWTHRNAMGRVVVNIGASYSADPEHVMAVLMRVAQECDLLLRYPEPFVAFEEFGASSLDFSVRAFVSDVTKSMSTRTALRVAIYKAFKEEGIEIPFPQQDVHLRDLDGIRSALKRVAEERLKAAGGMSTGQSAAKRTQATDVSDEDVVQAGDTTPDGESGGEGR